MSSSVQGPRVLIAGGSVLHGLGYEGTPFGRSVAERLDASAVLDLSGVSRTCRQIIEENRNDIASFGADVAILMVAGTESLIRPSHRVQQLIERYAPANWHGVAGLEPRARYSRSRVRRTRQRIESRLKVAAKHLLFRVLGGGTPLLPFPDLARDLEELFTLVTSSCTYTIAVGLPVVDDRLFPGSAASFTRTNARVRSLCTQQQRSQFLPLDDVLVRWSDYLEDRLHLTGDGHEHITRRVLELYGSTGTTVGEHFSDTA